MDQKNILNQIKSILLNALERNNSILPTTLITQLVLTLSRTISIITTPQTQTGATEKAEPTTGTNEDCIFLAIEIYALLLGAKATISPTPVYINRHIVLRPVHYMLPFPVAERILVSLGQFFGLKDVSSDTRDNVNSNSNSGGEEKQEVEGFKYSNRVRVRAIEVFELFLNKVEYVIPISQQPELLQKTHGGNSNMNMNMDLPNTPGTDLVTLAEYLNMQRQANYLAFCICGLLDNVTDIENNHNNFNEHYLTKQQQQEKEKETEKIKERIEIQLKTISEKTLEVLGSLVTKYIAKKTTLQKYFPGLVSTLVKISVGKTNYTKQHITRSSTNKSNKSKSYNNNTHNSENDNNNDNGTVSLGWNGTNEYGRKKLLFYKPRLRCLAMELLGALISITLNNADFIDEYSWFIKDSSTRALGSQNIATENGKIGGSSERALDKRLGLFAGDDTEIKESLEREPDNDNTVWALKVLEKLSVGLKLLVKERYSESQLVRRAVVRLFGTIVSKSYICLYNVLGLSIQTLLISLDQFYNNKQTSIGADISNGVTQYHNKPTKPSERLGAEQREDAEYIISILTQFMQDVLGKDEAMEKSTKIRNKEGITQIELGLQSQLKAQIIDIYDKLWDLFPSYMQSLNEQSYYEGLCLMANYSLWLSGDTRYMLSKGERDVDDQQADIKQQASSIILDRWTSVIVPSLLSFTSKSDNYDRNSSGDESVSTTGGKLMLEIVDSDSKAPLNPLFNNLTIQDTSNDTTGTIAGNDNVNSKNGMERQITLYFIKCVGLVGNYNVLANELYRMINNAIYTHLKPQLLDLLNLILTVSLETIDYSTVATLYDDYISMLNAFTNTDSNSNANTSTRMTEYSDSFSMDTNYYYSQQLAVLEGLSLLCKYSDKSFIIYSMEDLLFPLILLQSDKKLKTASFKCLQAISTALDLTSIDELISSNADYILMGCSRQLTRLDFSNDVLNLLTNTIRIMEPQNAITFSTDIVDLVMDSIDTLYSQGIYTTPRSEISSFAHHLSASTVHPSNELMDTLSFLNTLSNCILKTTGYVHKKDNILIDNMKSAKRRLVTPTFEVLETRIRTHQYGSNEHYSIGTDELDHSNELTNQSDNDPLSKLTTPANRNQKLLIKMILFSKNYISNSDPSIQLLAIKNLETCLKSLVDTEELLPLVNETWPLLVNNLKIGISTNISCFTGIGSGGNHIPSTDIYVVLACLKVINLICKLSGDWLISRIRDELFPILKSSIFPPSPSSPSSSKYSSSSAFAATSSLYSIIPKDHNLLLLSNHSKLLLESLSLISTIFTVLPSLPDPIPFDLISLVVELAFHPTIANIPSISDASFDLLLNICCPAYPDLLWLALHNTPLIFTSTPLAKSKIDKLYRMIDSLED